MMNLPKDKHIILFDGVCNLCNCSVQYVIKHDTLDKFLFAPLESNIGQHIIELYKIDTSTTDSIILHHKNQTVFYKSTAAIKIAVLLGFPNNLLSVFLIIPTFIRNWVYDYIAKNRYKWYGKQEACMIPTPELKSKFLD